MLVALKPEDHRVAVLSRITDPKLAAKASAAVQEGRCFVADYTGEDPAYPAPSFVKVPLLHSSLYVVLLLLCRGGATDTRSSLCILHGMLPTLLHATESCFWPQTTPPQVLHVQKPQTQQPFKTLHHLQ